MEKLEVFYDHYKETIKICSDMQTKRNKTLVFVCILKILSFIALLFPMQATAGLAAFINAQYEIVLELSISFLQCAIWIAFTYALVRYFQTTIYIERQYSYIALIEKKISQLLEYEHFDRESSFYLDKYPKALDLIHIFYVWVIPLVVITISLFKMVLELLIGTPVLPFIVNAIFCVFCVVLSILYLSFHHHRKDRRKP